uniref:DNA-directed RNA polymerase subunit beta'' n=1 Tax=Chaetophora sp. FACHB-2423 TaxID=2725789 RepID=A0A6H1XEB4_9CHLO|nr:beta'' subunit of RNA polymerase [Chaetophora sp. FACHB-2423]
MYLYKAIKNHNIQISRLKKRNYENEKESVLTRFSRSHNSFFFKPKNSSYGDIFSNFSLKYSRVMPCDAALKKLIRTDSKIVSFATKELPQVFWNLSFNKGILKNFVFWCFVNYGQRETIKILEKLQIIGFGYATKAGISLSIDDLKIPPTKAMLLADADKSIEAGFLSYKKAQLTGLERFQRIIETWHKTSENLKDEMINNFRQTDSLNPVYMMAFSGARGNISQVRQLVAMRGLMSDPQGKILSFPIRSNFREGLTLTEYVISCYGARKGVVDTALRTANAGYLTRRLVDVAQHVIVLNFDCGTKKGFYLTEMKKFNKTLYPLRQRLLGRVLAAHLYNINPFFPKRQIKNEELQIVAFRNQEISEPVADKISKITNKVFIRSPLTCDTPRLVCQLCYGWSLSEGYLVSIGEAVGIIAAQSIGEPGTQLTMRTFHTGGVFAGEMFDQLISPYDGVVQYSSSIPGTLVRTTQGKIAFLTKVEGKLSIFAPLPLSSAEREEKHNSSLISSSNNNQNSSPRGTPSNRTNQSHHTDGKKSPLFEGGSFPLEAKTFSQKSYKLPAYTLLFLRNNETILKDQLIAELAFLSSKGKKKGEIAEFIVKSEIEGQLYSGSVNILEKYSDYNDILTKSLDWGSVWILSGKICQLPVNSSFFALPGDLVDKNAILSQIQWVLPMKSLLDTNSLLKQNRNKEIYFDFNLNKNKWFQKRNLETLNTLFNLKFEIKKKNRTKKRFFKKADFFSDFQAPFLTNVSSKKKLEIFSNFSVPSKKVLSYYPFVYLAKLGEKKFKLLSDFYPNLMLRKNSKSFEKISFNKDKSLLFKLKIRPIYEFTKLEKKTKAKEESKKTQLMKSVRHSARLFPVQMGKNLERKMGKRKSKAFSFSQPKWSTFNAIFPLQHSRFSTNDPIEKNAQSHLTSVFKTTGASKSLKNKAQLFVGFNSQALKKNESLLPILSFAPRSRLFPILKQNNSVLPRISNQIEDLFDLKNKININLPLIFLCIDNIYYKKVGYFFSFKLKKKLGFSSKKKLKIFSSFSETAFLKRMVSLQKKDWKDESLNAPVCRSKAFYNQDRGQKKFNRWEAKKDKASLFLFPSYGARCSSFFAENKAFHFNSLCQDIFFVPTLLEQRNISFTKKKTRFKQKNYISNQLLHWFPKSYLTRKGGICIYLLTHDFFCHYINFKSFSFASEKKKGNLIENVDVEINNSVSSNLLAKIFWVNQDYKKKKLYSLKFFFYSKFLEQLRACPINLKRQIYKLSVTEKNKLNARKLKERTEKQDWSEYGSFRLYTTSLVPKSSFSLTSLFFTTVAFHRVLNSVINLEKALDKNNFVRKRNHQSLQYKTTHIKKYQDSSLRLNFYKNLTYYCSKNKNFKNFKNLSSRKSTSSQGLTEPALSQLQRKSSVNSLFFPTQLNEQFSNSIFIIGGSGFFLSHSKNNIFYTTNKKKYSFFSLKKTNIIKKSLNNNSIMNSFIYKPQKFLNTIGFGNRQTGKQTWDRLTGKQSCLLSRLSAPPFDGGSFPLHKKFFLPGHKIVDDISFDNFLIYVECIPLCRLSSLSKTIYKTEFKKREKVLRFGLLNGKVNSFTSPFSNFPCFNLKKLIINKLPRFIKTSQFLSNISSLSLENPTFISRDAPSGARAKLFTLTSNGTVKRPQSSSFSPFVLLITKVLEYPVYKPNHYKNLLYNSQKTAEQSFFHYSCKVKSKMLNKIFKNNYHSNILNKQKSSLRLLDKFPNIDLVVALKCKGLQNDLMENFLQKPLNLNLYLRLKKQKSGTLRHFRGQKKLTHETEKESVLRLSSRSQESVFLNERLKKTDNFLLKPTNGKVKKDKWEKDKATKDKASLYSENGKANSFASPLIGPMFTLPFVEPKQKISSRERKTSESFSSQIKILPFTASREKKLAFFSHFAFNFISKKSLKTENKLLEILAYGKKSLLKRTAKDRQDKSSTSFFSQPSFSIFFGKTFSKSLCMKFFSKNSIQLIELVLVGLQKNSLNNKIIGLTVFNFFQKTKLKEEEKKKRQLLFFSHIARKKNSDFFFTRSFKSITLEQRSYASFAIPDSPLGVRLFSPRGESGVQTFLNPDFQSHSNVHGSKINKTFNSKASVFYFLDKKLKKQTRIQPKFIVSTFEKSDFSFDLLGKTKKKYSIIGKSSGSCFTTFNYENIKIMNNNISQSILQPSFYFNYYQKSPFGYYLINNLNLFAPFSFSFSIFFSRSNNTVQNYFLFYKLLAMFNQPDFGKKSKEKRELKLLQAYEQSISYFSLISSFFQQPCFHAFFTQQVSFGYNEQKNVNQQNVTFSKKVGTLREGKVGLSPLLHSTVYFKKDSLSEQGEIALTRYLSPFLGEILRHENYYWSQNTQKNRYLLLTKKDQISFFSNNSNIQKETSNNFSVGTENFFPPLKNNLTLGEFLTKGDYFTLKSQNSIISSESGLIIHLNKSKITLRKAQSFFLSPNCIFHYSHGDLVEKNKSILSLPYEQLKTGDIVQGIPKVEQLLEARSTFKGKEEEDNLHKLLKYVFELYKIKFSLKLSVRKSFSFIQLILVNSVQRIYRSQGVSISDKHLEVIVKQMTSKVQITSRGDSSFFRGEHVDLYIVETWNALHPQIKKICYKPILLGISRSSLEVNSFLSAASFQHTKKVLSRSAFKTNIDFLNGLKENVIIGNLISAGTGNLNN